MPVMDRSLSFLQQSRHYILSNFCLDVEDIINLKMLNERVVVKRQESIHNHYANACHTWLGLSTKITVCEDCNSCCRLNPNINVEIHGYELQCFTIKI